jgi:hypothetical protein
MTPRVQRIESEYQSLISFCTLSGGALATVLPRSPAMTEQACHSGATRRDCLSPPTYVAEFYTRSQGFRLGYWAALKFEAARAAA